MGPDQAVSKKGGRQRIAVDLVAKRLPLRQKNAVAKF
jgi:hypothetical protein